MTIGKRVCADKYGTTTMKFLGVCSVKSLVFHNNRKMKNIVSDALMDIFKKRYECAKMIKECDILVRDSFMKQSGVDKTYHPSRNYIDGKTGLVYSIVMSHSDSYKEQSGSIIC